MKQAEKYPLIFTPLADKPGGPTGAQRVRALLKVARRQFRLRADWQPKFAGSDTGSDTRSAANTAKSERIGTCETSEADMRTAAEDLTTLPPKQGRRNS
jgi:hypothetical protein